MKEKLRHGLIVVSCGALISGAFTLISPFLSDSTKSSHIQRGGVYMAGHNVSMPKVVSASGGNVSVSIQDSRVAVMGGGTIYINSRVPADAEDQNVKVYNFNE